MIHPRHLTPILNRDNPKRALDQPAASGPLIETLTILFRLLITIAAQPGLASFALLVVFDTLNHDRVALRDRVLLDLLDKIV